MPRSLPTPRALARLAPLALFALFALFALPFPAAAQPTTVTPVPQKVPPKVPQDDPQEAPRKGTFTQRFRATHPLGSFATITKRLRMRKGTIQKSDPDAKLEIADESFFVHVPKNYARDKGFGLLVWISPGPQGNCGVDWPAALEQHKLVFVGANNSGNNRFIWYRIALALAAVRNLRQRYDIDAERIYVVGHSGGGRMASTLAMLWPDVFRGGIYCCGVNHFRAIKKPGQQFVWPAKFPKPIGKLLGLAKRSSRHVILNGEKDFNLVHSRAVYRDLRQNQGFAHVTFFLMKGRGHAAPDKEWLAKSITALDAPLFKRRKNKKARADRTASLRPAIPLGMNSGYDTAVLRRPRFSP